MNNTKTGQGDVLRIEDWAGGPQRIGGTGASPEAACDFALGAMSFGDAVREQPADVQQAIRRDLVALFRSHATLQREAAVWAN